jgi:regulator of sigma E protease
MPGSAAERAGLRVKDRLVSIEGQLIDGSEAVTALVANSAGRTLKFVIERPREEPSSEASTNAQTDRLSFQASPEKIAESTVPEFSFPKEGYRLGIRVAPRAVETKRWNARLSAEGAIALCRYSLTLLRSLVMGRVVVEDLRERHVVRLANQLPDLGIAARVALLWTFGFFPPSFLLGIINLLPLPFLDGGRLFKVTLQRLL